VKEETRGVKEAVEGLREEFQMLGDVGRAIVKVLAQEHPRRRRVRCGSDGSIGRSWGRSRRWSRG